MKLRLDISLALLLLAAGQALAGDEEGSADLTGNLELNPGDGEFFGGGGDDDRVPVGLSNFTSVNVKTSTNKIVSIFIPQPVAVGFPIQNFPAYGHLNAQSMSFIALGDWGVDPSVQPPAGAAWGVAEQQRISQQISSLAEKSKINLVVSTGNNFLESGVLTVTDPRWNTTFENNFKINAPWYAVLGRNDYLQNSAANNDQATQAQIRYTASSKRWFMPWYYYTRLFFVQSPDSNFTVQFIFLDTTSLLGWSEGGCRWDRGADEPEWCKGDQVPKEEEQLQWLEDTLSSSIADWLFVVGHHPVYSVGQAGMQNYPLGSSNPDFTKKMMALLPKYNVTAYLSGHDHVNQVLGMNSASNYYTAQYGNVALFGVGCTGKLDGKIVGNQEKLQQMYSSSAQLKFNSLTPGFGVVNITSQQFTYTVVDQYGKTLYTETYGRTRWIDIEAVAEQRSKLVDGDRKDGYGVSASRIVLIIGLSITIAIGIGYLIYRRAFVAGQFNPAARLQKSRNDHAITIEKDSGASVLMMKKKPAQSGNPPATVAGLEKGVKQLDSL